MIRTFVQDISSKKNMATVATTKIQTRSVDYESMKIRNARAINIAHSFIPLSKSNVQIVNVLFHKNLEGFVMIGLNKFNEPVKAWCNIDGIVPIHRHIVKIGQFCNILNRLDPQTVYLNDGELLKPFLCNHKLVVYHSKTLREILDDIKISPQVTCNNVAKSSFTKKSSTRNTNNVVDDDSYKVPTFEEMVNLDPTLTKRQYKIFYSKMLN